MRKFLTKTKMNRRVLLGALGAYFALGQAGHAMTAVQAETCLLYTSPSPRDKRQSRMPSSA